VENIYSLILLLVLIGLFESIWFIILEMQKKIYALILRNMALED
jgi:hypothetical protein